MDKLERDGGCWPRLDPTCRCPPCAGSWRLTAPAWWEVKLHDVCGVHFRVRALATALGANSEGKSSAKHRARVPLARHNVSLGGFATRNK